MRIDTFKIEEWMNHYCPLAKYDLTTTCIEPLSINDLLEICSVRNFPDVFDTKLTYGDIHGSDRLKNAICSLYSNQKQENITVTHGAIGANQLVFETLLEPNDKVVVAFPIYQQHYSLPESYGIKVRYLPLKEENNWLPNLRSLEIYIEPDTKIICLNTPNNPTGSVIPDEMLHQIVKIAEKRNCWILSDEVYRGLNLSGNPYSVSIADIYSKGISVGSMSKTYSLPGLRLGWIAADKYLINEINQHREYNTISVSILDDYFSALALENKDKIAKRNFKIMQEGFKILTDWLSEEDMVSAVVPRGGTTALVRYKKDIPSRILCHDLQEKTGVALLPGETLKKENTVRIGFCAGPQNLKIGLKLFSEYLKNL